MYDEEIANQPKQGHKYCFSMCDTRRAVIIVNALQIIGGILGMILFGIALKRNNDGTLVNKELLDFFAGADTADVTGAFIGMGLRLILNTIGLVGALHYNTCMVGTCFVWFAVQAIFAGIGHVWGFMVVCILFAYVHVFFIMEVNSGIMSPATYPREKHSCCCV